MGYHDGDCGIEILKPVPDFPGGDVKDDLGAGPWAGGSRSVGDADARVVVGRRAVDEPSFQSADERGAEVRPRHRRETFEGLAAAAGQGDVGAAEKLWSAVRPRLVRMALAMGAPPDDVPDLVQDVLLAAWRNLDRFDPAQGSLVGWLIPGLRGRLLNQVRGRRRRSRLAQQLGRLWGGQHTEAERPVEAKLTLHRLLAVLTPRQREVVALYDLEGLSARETAQLLEVSEAGVRSLARSARRRLSEEAHRLEG